MKSGLMVSWVKRGFSSSAARLAVMLLILLAAGSAQAVTYNLLVGKSGSGDAGTTAGSGTVSSTPGGISCGSNCYDTFVYDAANPTIVTLSASPAPGSIFMGWSVLPATGNYVCPSADVCAIVMDSNHSVIAKFDLAPAAVGLTVATDPLGTGSGTVTSYPGPMYCGPSCYGTFAANTLVTLTATPAAGSKLASWNVNGVIGSNAVAVTAVAVDAAKKTVTLTLASAVPAGLPVSIAYADPTAGNDVLAIQDASANDAASLASASVTNMAGVTDTAPPVFGMATVNGNQLVMSYLDASNLDNGNVPGVGAFTVRLNGAVNVVTGVVVSAANKTVTLTLTTAAITGDTVSVAYTDPTTAVNDANAIQDAYGNDAASLPTTNATNITGAPADAVPPVFGMATVNGNQLVMSYLDANALDAVNLPADGAFTVVFGCSSTSLTCSVTMDAAKTVTVKFDTDPNAKNLSVIKTGTGSGIVRSNPSGIYCGAFCNETFPLNRLLTLSAAPDSGSTFTGWSGATGCTTELSCLVTMDDSKTVKANFDFSATPANFTLTILKGGTGAGLVTSDPTGIKCDATLVLAAISVCNTGYAGGTLVALSATAPTGSTFVGWGGVGITCSGTGTCFVTMDAAKNVTAIFNADNTLTVTKVGTGGGTVTSDSGTLACGSLTSVPPGDPKVCSASYLSGTLVSLTATPDAGSTFASWGGDCTGSTVCQVTLSAAKNVTATFTQISYAITVSKSGNGAGLVTSSPAGVNCGGAGLVCSASYANGTVVTLTATPTAGNIFVGWSGSICSGSVPTCVVTMDGAKSVTATFNTSSALTVALVGTGTVTSDSGGISCSAATSSLCSANYVSTALVTLTATPDAGSSFVRWSGDCVGSTMTCAVTMSAARNVTATFSANKITVTKDGTGTGTVTSNSGGINCGLSCSANYLSGTLVTLTAAPDATSSFAGWSGDCAGSATCVVTMSAVRNVTATFNLVSYSITVAKAGSGTGTVTSDSGGINCGASCSASYAGGSSVTLTAAADSNNSFVGWSGNCTGSSTTCSLTNITATKNVTATFTNTHSVTATVSPVVTPVAGTVTCTPNPVNHSGRSTCTVTSTSPGYSFTAWSGDCLGATCSMGNITADKTVIANFTQTTFGISATASPAAGGSVSCDKNPVGYGETSICKATPNLGYNFKAWGSCPTATATNECTLSNVKANTSVSATFTAITNAVSTSTLSASPSSQTQTGNSTTLTVKVTGAAGTPTGSVVFRNAGVTLGTMLLSGTGEASYSANFSVGLHSLSASYAGNSTYQASTSNVIGYQVYSIPTTLSVRTHPTQSQPGVSVPVTVIVTSPSNPANISGTVQVSSGDGQNCSLVLPINSCTLTFASKGVKKLTASYSGNSVYSASSATSTHFVGRQANITPIMMLLLD